jgi:energy-coupling factor transporter ATP-binding protein EcfA2
VGEGAAILLRGANGQGKTTLLELIAGLHPPGAGRIERAGQAVHTLSWRARSRWVGYLPQRADLILCARTVADELALPLRARGHGAARIRETVAEWLERLHLTRHAGRFPHLLSRGERQRLALGTVLVAAPTLLLLDEPFAGQDPHQTRQIVNLLRAFLGEDPRRAVIVATHDEEPALAWAGAVWTLDRGRLSVEQSPGVPAAPWTAPAAGAAALSPGAAGLPLSVEGGRP